MDFSDWIEERLAITHAASAWDEKYQAASGVEARLAIVNAALKTSALSKSETWLERRNRLLLLQSQRAAAALAATTAKKSLLASDTEGLAQQAENKSAYLAKVGQGVGFSNTILGNLSHGKGGSTGIFKRSSLFGG